ncbi:hypothetical protein REPUB_Repub02eG0217400 [Reevesia pubescens]
MKPKILGNTDEHRFNKMATATADVTSNYDRMKDIKEFDQSKVGVKGLIDSSIASIPGIFIQPPETLSTLNPSQITKLASM